MLHGKGYYIWQVSRVEGGNAATIVQMAQAARLEHILIKIADGTFSSNVSGTDLVAPLVSALTARGIEVWGWHYVYGDDPAGEAQKALQRIQQTGVAGYIIDAEAQYKEPGKDLKARAFMNAMRTALPFFPIALSSYRFPSIHPDFPWQEFLTRVDYAMPQVYWMFAHNPREQLARTLVEYRSMTDLPIVPTGAAYAESGWAPTTAEVLDFLDAAVDNNLGGANFWEWYAARQLPNMWETIAGFVWPSSPPPVILAHGRVNTDLLNIRSGPGTGYFKVGSLKFGTRVTIFQAQGDWVKISPDRELWVSSLYLDRLP